MIKLMIGLLAALALVLLYRGMRQEQAAVNPLAPLNNDKILAVIRGNDLPCDNVDTFTPLGKTKRGDADAYLARCRDGGRYIYFESRPKGQVDVMTCQQEAYHFNYRCPK